jgi:hypothetical protein
LKPDALSERGNCIAENALLGKIKVGQALLLREAVVVAAAPWLWVALETASSFNYCLWVVMWHWSRRLRASSRQVQHGAQHLQCSSIAQDFTLLRRSQDLTSPTFAALVEVSSYDVVANVTRTVQSSNLELRRLTTTDTSGCELTSDEGLLHCTQD